MRIIHLQRKISRLTWPSALQNTFTSRLWQSRRKTLLASWSASSLRKAHAEMSSADGATIAPTKILINRSGNKSGKQSDLQKIGEEKVLHITIHNTTHRKSRERVKVPTQIILCYTYVSNCGGGGGFAPKVSYICDTLLRKFIMADKLMACIMSHNHCYL